VELCGAVSPVVARLPALLLLALLPLPLALGCGQPAGRDPTVPVPAGSSSAGASSTPTPGQPGQPGTDSPIANVWRAKCGTCHTRVEPGTRPRDVLETALQAHRVRVRLNEREWAQLLDFLAP
jgi:hypothetical protein